MLTHHKGKVLFLSRPMRFLLMVVEHGTASRWWELLGRVGTHWLFLLAFCSLERSEQGLDSALQSLLMFSAHYCAPGHPPRSCGGRLPGTCRCLCEEGTEVSDTEQGTVGKPFIPAHGR